MKDATHHIMQWGGLIILFIMLVACNKEKDVFHDDVTKGDYNYIVDVLNNFNIPDELVSESVVAYKSIGYKDNTIKHGFYLYVIQLPEKGKERLISILNESKTLIKGSLSDDILFALKAGDKDAFDIRVLQPERPDMDYYLKDDLKPDDEIFSTKNLFFHYQRLRVYEDPSKVNILERRKKFVMFELEKNRILYYNCYYKYR